MSQILLGLVSALVSIVVGAVANYVFELLRNRSRRRQFPLSTYSDKMANLTKSLIDAAAEVDRVLNEMSEVSRQKETSIANLETRLVGLAERERLQQENIQALKGVPLPAAQYFAQVIQRGEKRSAWRDYILFGSGVVVSTVIAIVLAKLFAH